MDILERKTHYTTSTKGRTIFLYIVGFMSQRIGLTRVCLFLYLYSLFVPCSGSCEVKGSWTNKSPPFG